MKPDFSRIKERIKAKLQKRRTLGAIEREIEQWEYQKAVYQKRRDECLKMYAQYKECEFDGLMHFVRFEDIHLSLDVDDILNVISMADMNARAQIRGIDDRIAILKEKYNKTSNGYGQ